MAGKLLLGLLLCGGVAAENECQALIIQQDTGLTGFLYASKTDNVAKIESMTMPHGRTDGGFEKECGVEKGTKSNPDNLFLNPCQSTGIFGKNPFCLSLGSPHSFAQLSITPPSGSEAIQPTAQSLVRWYKEEILKMLKMEGGQNCKLTKIVVRQIGKMREALLLKDREKDKKAWAKWMKHYLNCLMVEGDLTEPLKKDDPSLYDFALVSNKEQKALLANDLTSLFSKILFEKNKFTFFGG